MAATIAIMIGTPDGTRLLAAGSERSAALMAESVINRVRRASLPVPVWVQCGDAAAARRLTEYLADVQAELVCEIS